MKKKSKQKYKPLSEAQPGELREAMKLTSFWLTDVLEDCTEVGAFSEANLGEPAILYFPKRAYLALKDPKTKWHWKAGTKSVIPFYGGTLAAVLIVSVVLNWDKIGGWF